MREVVSVNLLWSFNSATDQILKKARQVVNTRKEDGFTALQLASLNGHLDVVKSLISVVSFIKQLAKFF